MSKQPRDWEIYEEAARHVVEQLKDKLGVDSVEGKQTVQGACGTEWEIDAMATTHNGGHFLIIEARQYRTSRISQEAMAAVAFRVSDIGAKGGIVASPLPLQKGAEIVAHSADIKHLKLAEWSTAENYLAEFMGNAYHGITEHARIELQEHLEITVIDKHDGDNSS